MSDDILFGDELLNFLTDKIDSNDLRIVKNIIKNDEQVLVPNYVTMNRILVRKAKYKPVVKELNEKFYKKLCFSDEMIKLKMGLMMLHSKGIYEKSQKYLQSLSPEDRRQLHAFGI